MSIEARVDAFASLGFREGEFGIGGDFPGRLPEQATSEEISTFRRLHDDRHVHPSFGVLENDFTLSDARAHAAQVERAKTLMQKISACGATTVRLFTGFTPLTDMSEAIWSRLFAALAEAQDLASRLGLTIALETHHAVAHRSAGPAVHLHTATTHRDGVERLLNEMPAEIGFLWDPGNVKTVEPDDDDYLLSVINGRINAAHLKDWRHTANGGWETVAPGEDDIDYARALPRTGYDGVSLIEYEGRLDPSVGTERGLSYLLPLGAQIA